MSTLRATWRPRLPEIPEQCASCPFRMGNAKEFGAIVCRLRQSQGITKPPSKKEVGSARMSVMMDVTEQGDFACHNTVYTQDMALKPVTERRQCKGATEWYRRGGA